MFLKISQISHETLVVKSLFNTVAGLLVCSFDKKVLRHRCFPMKVAKVLRTHFFTEHLSNCFYCRSTQFFTRVNFIRRTRLYNGWKTRTTLEQAWTWILFYKQELSSLWSFLRRYVFCVKLDYFLAITLHMCYFTSRSYIWHKAVFA